MERLSYEKIELGQIWVSPGRTVTETDIVNFAGMTGDFNPLHVDHEFAANTPFKKPIAHGLLGLSWVAGLGSHAPNVDTVAFIGVQDWRFLKPLYAGDTVHVHTEAISKTPRGRRNGQVVWMRRLINQDGEVVQEGKFETLVRCKTTSSSSSVSVTPVSVRSADPIHPIPPQA